VLSTGPDGRTMVIEVPRGVQQRRHGKAGRGGRRGRRGAPIGYTAFGRDHKTKHRVAILQRPTLRGFSPATASPGAEIIVNGKNFTPTTVVYFGNTPMPVVSRNLPIQLIVRVPADARGADHVWVEEIGARVRSKRPLMVVAPPTITGFTPRKGKPGTQVTIHGQDLGANVEVLLGNAPCRIISRRGDSIAVEVPVGAPGGKQYFELRDNKLSSQARMPFKVQAVAFLSRFEPAEGPPGTQITLHGRDFDRRTRAFFGDIELRVTKVGRRGKRMWVTLPPTVTGSAQLSVDEDGIRSYSNAQFRVLQPPPPPPPRRGKVRVRDHRRGR
jgi:hypothetical protein